MSALGLALGLPFSRPAGGGAPYFGGVLDLLSDGYLAGWSIYRNLFSSYSGSLIRVRADRTGQPEEDFGFTANGILDIEGLLTFAGSDSCYIRAVYGQNIAFNMEQTSAGSQPRIVDAGALEVNNLNIPAMRMSGQTLSAEFAVPLTWPWSAYSNQGGVMDSNFRILWGVSDVARAAGKLNTNKFYVNGGIVSGLDVTVNNQFLAYYFATAASSDIMRVDGVDSGVTDGGGDPAIEPASITWGDLATSGAPWSGKTSELILFQGVPGTDSPAFADLESALILS